MAEGYIYVMTNPALMGMVKIGYTQDVEQRRKSLSSTSLPFEFEVFATYKVSGDLRDNTLHRLIDAINPDLRVASNREFYRITPLQAYNLLKAMAVFSGTEGNLCLVGECGDDKQGENVLPLNFSKNNASVSSRTHDEKCNHLIANFLVEMLPQFKWDYVPMTLLHPIYVEWCRRNDYSDMIMGRNKYEQHVRTLVSQLRSLGWEYNDTWQRPTKLSSDGEAMFGSNVYGPEPLIATYGITRWYRAGYIGDNIDKACTPLFPSNRIFKRGLARIGKTFSMCALADDVPILSKDSIQGV